MAKNEKTSPRVAKIASKLMKVTKKSQFTLKEMKSVVGSAFTQVKDKKKKKSS